MSSGSQILTKYWRLNCSIFARQSSSELWTKLTPFKALPTSSDLSYCDLRKPFLKARHIWTTYNGYDKIKVANGIQQRSYISCSWSGVCVFWQFCKVLKGLRNSMGKNLISRIIFLIDFNYIICIHIFI